MDDPDWMNEFKSPTENAVLDLSSSSPSSSPSREVKGKHDNFSGATEGASVSNGKDGSEEEDNLLISALRGARAAKKALKESEKSPVKKAAKPSRKAVVKDEDDEEASPMVVSIRPNGWKKRALEFSEEEDDEEYQMPSKVRKTSASPQVKKVTPKSGRKGRRVSFSEGEGTPQAKRVKRELPLKDPFPTDEEDDEEKPISSLVRKKDKGDPTPIRTATVSPAVDDDDFNLTAPSQESRGSTALAALRDPGGTPADGEGVPLAKEDHEEETGEISERKGKQRGSANLPVIFAEKVHRTKVLLECEGDALDLSGDMGAVGRFSVDSGNERGGDELLLDLKGIIYKTTIVPSNTFFVVNVGPAEAKKYTVRRNVEAIMNDFMQLRPDVNQFQDETLVEGTLEGFDLENDNDGEPLSTPAAAAGPIDSGDDGDDPKQKKKTPSKLQKQTKALGKGGKGGKGGRPKGAGKGGTKKPRAKAKAATKKQSSVTKSVKSKKS